MVSGSFLEWDPAGVALEDPDGDMIYEVAVPVEFTSDKPVSYKYRIIKPVEKPQGYVPFDGWEQVGNRQIGIAETRDSNQVDYFNNQMRVARFVFGKSWLTDSANVNLKKGDVLQVKLRMGSDTFLSDPLILTQQNQYETSLAVPLDKGDVQWSLVKNQYILLTEFKPVQIDHSAGVL